MARSPQLQGSEEVHPLVLRLLKERVYPPVVPLQVPQATEVPRHGCHHARYPGNRLQEDDPGEPSPLVQGPQELAGGVAGEQGAEISWCSRPARCR